MRLMQQIGEFRVERNSVALWWLGQNSFLIKTPEGTVAGVDLYLTDSCAALGAGIGIDLQRRAPVLIEPEELQVDLFACTHNHQDHTDPETLRRLRNKDTAMFLGPMPSCGTFRAEGIEDGRIQPAWPQCDIEFRDLRVHGTFALPTDASDLNHMGFVVECAGVKIYVTGDTDYTELLHDAARHKPDAMITCINGGFNNLSHWEAAALAKAVRPRVAIPCHYDMFASNSADPRQFEAALRIQGVESRYAAMEYGQALVLERG